MSFLIGSESISLAKPFSHIYIEKDIITEPAVKSIISHFPASVITEINRYKDIFNRKNQSFSVQKASKALIIAKKHRELIYKGAPFCQSFGYDYFYYTSFVLNCVFDCEYCYLRGMYPSGNIVVFVNTDDFLKEAEKISQNKEIFLCVSYDTDLAALENIFGFCSLWYDFAKKHKNVNIELRTKTADMSFLKGLEPVENFITALTLSPANIASKHEAGVPSLEKRLSAAKEVTRLGFPLRLSFDPILKTDSFEKTYNEFICKCFSELDPSLIKDIGLGCFRISPSYLKSMRKNYPSSLIACYPYELSEGAYSYPEKEKKYMTEYVEGLISKYMSKDKIYLWNT